MSENALFEFVAANLNIDILRDLGKQVVLFAENTLPGKTGAEKKAWATNAALEVLEKFDDKIYWLGQWADLPLVDWLERWVVGLLIEWAWGALTLDHVINVKAA